MKVKQFVCQDDADVLEGSRIDGVVIDVSKLFDLVLHDRMIELDLISGLQSEYGNLKNSGSVG